MVKISTDACMQGNKLLTFSPFIYGARIEMSPYNYDYHINYILTVVLVV